MALEQHRQSIDEIDRSIVELLARRRRIANQVIELKKEQSLPLRCSRREEEILDRLARLGRPAGLDPLYLTRVFRQIIDDSVRLQEDYLQARLNGERAGGPLRVAFQGIDGAYSHLAARRFFAAPTCRYRPCSSFEEVVDAVEEGNADYGLLPIENTTAGSISEVYDLLQRSRLRIVGEEVFPVDHCLLAIAEVPVASLRKVLSHWQALAQCSRFLGRLEHCEAVPFEDTAKAARQVLADGDPTQAAIASEEAARRHGLTIIERRIADQPENYTRFVVVSPQPIRVDLRVPSKTSLVMATEHHAGSLLKALAVLERHGLNLTKLESRPKHGAPFQYLFFLDFEGNAEEVRVRSALAELRSETSFVTVLGTYPITDRRQPLRAAEAAPATEDAPVDGAAATGGSG